VKAGSERKRATERDALVSLSLGAVVNGRGTELNFPLTRMKEAPLCSEPFVSEGGKMGARVNVLMNFSPASPLPFFFDPISFSFLFLSSFSSLHNPFHRPFPPPTLSGMRMHQVEAVIKPSRNNITAGFPVHLPSTSLLVIGARFE